MAREGAAAGATQVLHFADLCYIGQSYHIEVPLDAAAADPLPELYRAFRAAHDRIYGHSTDGPARIVNLRSIHRSAASAARPEPYAPNCRPAGKGTRRILTGESADFVEAAIFERAALAVGQMIEGPAIVEQEDTTTLIEPGWRGTVAANGTLMLTAR
jgi:N-methylhydantoinase A/oxoprolinase/acetone carboxylase beta subunit